LAKWLFNFDYHLASKNLIIFSEGDLSLRYHNQLCLPYSKIGLPKVDFIYWRSHIQWQHTTGGRKSSSTGGITKKGYLYHYTLHKAHFLQLSANFWFLKCFNYHMIQVKLQHQVQKISSTEREWLKSHKYTSKTCMCVIFTNKCLWYFDRFEKLSQVGISVLGPLQFPFFLFSCGLVALEPGKWNLGHCLS